MRNASGEWLPFVGRSLAGTALLSWMEIQKYLSFWLTSAHGTSHLLAGHLRLTLSQPLAGPMAANESSCLKSMYEGERRRREFATDIYLHDTQWISNRVNPTESGRVSPVAGGAA
jgi:hypothetical protein